MAGLLAFVDILYDSGVARLLLAGFYYKWLASSEAAAERGYRELLSGNRKEAVEIFRDAVERDRESPYRWCDYGEALLAEGRREEARKCMQRAAESGPYIPPILMRVANFHFRLGEVREGLPYAKRILKLVREYDEVIFGTWDRLGVSTGEVVESGLPDRRSAEAYLRHLMAAGPAREAEQAWGWMEGHGYTDNRLTDEYVGYLVRAKEYSAAVKTWARLGGGLEPGYPEENAIYNGSFERAPVGTVFDWRIDAVGGAQVERVRSEAGRGRWALQVSFDHTQNLKFQNVSERSRVEPGRYRFEAWVRTEEITTDQGIGFRISDPEGSGRLDVQTERLRGTNGWTNVAATITIPAGTEMVEVRLVREASVKFDNKVGGRAWIDGVAMRRQ